jgi:energy-coupling factor transporter ATP-binding protein EcfA2
MALFQDLWRTGITVVLITHEPDVARYAERLLVMRDGRIVSDQWQNAAEAPTSGRPRQAEVPVVAPLVSVNRR